MTFRLQAIPPMGTFESSDGRFFSVDRHEGSMTEVTELSTHKKYAWPSHVKVKIILPKKSDYARITEK